LRADPNLSPPEQERLKAEQARRAQIAADLRLESRPTSRPGPDTPGSARKASSGTRGPRAGAHHDVQHSLVRNRVESLRALAVNTDGLAIVDTNDLDGGFRRIADDLTSYYLLGY